MNKEKATQDQISDVAWMHFVAGLTQAEIAERRGLSRMKVHRLVQAALDQGIVQVFVNKVSSACITLEASLMAQYGLSSCVVAPDSDVPSTMAGTMPLVASAGAHYLHGRLEVNRPLTIGIGSGRTMSEVVRRLPTIKRKNATFISVTGDFAALSEANPFEVINGLVTKTSGTGYALTAPLIVDSEADCELFLRQRGIRAAKERLADADLIFVGIGHLGHGSFLTSFGLLDEEELLELRIQGAVADIAGNIMGADGELLSTSVTRRMIGLDPKHLVSRELVAVCSGSEKWQAARSVLRSGHLNGLITTQSLAEQILSEP